MDKNFLLALRCLFFSVALIPLVLIFPQQKDAPKEKTETNTSVTESEIEIKKPDVIFKENIQLEVGTAANVSNFILAVKNGELSADFLLDTSSVGKKTDKIPVKCENGEIVYYTFLYTVTDNVAPVLSVPATFLARKDKPVNLLSGVKVSDNSGEKITPVTTGNYSFSLPGTYTVTYTATDSSGNSGSATAVLTVIEYNVKGMRTPDSINTSNYHLPYAVTVYREYNTVVVYSPDEFGYYTVPVKVFICSCGKEENTPIGTFYTSNKYRWGRLVGGVYGQYSTRIVGGILFHSVPYFEQNPGSLEYLLYNNLGTKDSLGCVRLAVADCKWIYDNCPSKMAVTITLEPVPEDITRPEAIKIPEDSPNRGWDPTDPDPNNPWRKQ